MQDGIVVHCGENGSEPVRPFSDPFFIRDQILPNLKKRMRYAFHHAVTVHGVALERPVIGFVVANENVARGAQMRQKRIDSTIIRVPENRRMPGPRRFFPERRVGMQRQNQRRFFRSFSNTGQLKKERNAVKARSIANQIASEWNDSGSATINLLMQWAGEAADEKRNAAAYDFLDQVILLDPDYVQAPYRRAMVHFSDGDTRKAMADINLTLEKEPRYFPALASLANILEASGRDELALKAWERYLALYPADKDARKQAIDLSEKLAGTRG